MNLKHIIIKSNSLYHITPSSVLPYWGEQRDTVHRYSTPQTDTYCTPSRRHRPLFMSLTADREFTASMTERYFTVCSIPCIFLLHTFLCLQWLTSREGISYCSHERDQSHDGTVTTSIERVSVWRWAVWIIKVICMLPHPCWQDVWPLETHAGIKEEERHVFCGSRVPVLMNVKF